MNKSSFNSKRSGFTLVELAIVLVVIGLLMGMAFKGKSLVDASRTKAEVNRINKISTALNVYYSKYNTLPGSYGNGSNLGVRNMYDALINEGMLKDSDFGKGGTASASGNYIFGGCRHTADKNGNLIWTLVPLSQTDNVCIMQANDHIKNVAKDVSQYLGTTNWTNDFKVCQIETLLDDKNLYSGDGRIVSGGVGTSPLLKDKDFDCSKYASGKDTLKTSNGVSYMYRVF